MLIILNIINNAMYIVQELDTFNGLLANSYRHSCKQTCR